MSQYLETNKIEIIAEPGSSLASAIETKEVKLDNYQSAQIVISTGEGDKATTKASVVAILPDATEQEIKNEEITIGGNAENRINVVANEIAHYDATSIKIKVDAVADSTITCGIIALLGEPRYAVETEEAEVVENTEETVEETTNETPTEENLDGGEI